MAKTTVLTLEEIQNFQGKYPKQLWYLFLVEIIIILVLLFVLVIRNLLMFGVIEHILKFLD